VHVSAVEITSTEVTRTEDQIRDWIGEVVNLYKAGLPLEDATVRADTS
jgi:hypothetical protein